MFICQLSVQKLPNFYSVVYFHILISEISQYAVNSSFIKYLFFNILSKCVACLFITVKVAFEEEFLILMHQIYHFFFLYKPCFQNYVQGIFAKSKIKYIFSKGFLQYFIFTMSHFKS